MDDRLPDELLFDDQARNIANRDIDGCLEKFTDGRTDFPDAETLAFACDVLLILGGIQDDPNGRRVVDALSNPAGISYASVVSLMATIKYQANLAIDKARASRTAELHRVPVADSELPF